VKWTLIVVGLLIAASIGLALIGGKSGTKNPSDTIQPGALGSRSHPIPLGKAASIGGGWRLKVLRSTPNASRQVKAAENANYEQITGPPAGAADFMVKLALTYIGGGRGNLATVRDFAPRAMGAHHASYNLTDNSCSNYLPKPDLTRASAVFSGQTVKGNVCFQIAKNDAKTLKLYLGYSQLAKDFLGPSKLKPVWFALR
jgi:hypothetical protein